MGTTLSGLVSGIDTESLISQLVDLEYNRVRTVQASKKQTQVKISAYSQLQGLISDLRTKSRELQKEDGFNLFKIATTNNKDNEIVTVTANSGSVAGKYDLNVFQLAQNEKMVSKDGLIKSQSTALSTYGVTAGDISVDGTTISISATDTLQDVRMKINNATTSDGKKLGVSASVVKVADDNYRLVLTASKPGSAGVAYKDLTGSTLQDLGIITDAAGSKGTLSQIIQSADDFAAAFNSLAVGQSISYGGVDRDGNAVSNTYVKGSDDLVNNPQVIKSVDDFATAFAGLTTDQTVELSGRDHSGNAVTMTFTKTDTNTVDDFLSEVQTAFGGTVTASLDGDGKLTLTDTTSGASSLAIGSLKIDGSDAAVTVTQTGESGVDGFLAQIEETFHGMVSATLDASGKLTLTDKVGGASQINLTSLTVNGLAATVAISQAGRNGDGVLTIGRKAYFGIDGIAMEAESNSVTGSIAGVTLDLHKADPGKTVTIDMQRDLDGIAAKITKMLDSYNALVRFNKDNTSYGDPDDENSSKGRLAGDMTVRTILAQFRGQLQTRFENLGGKYGTLSEVGMKTDPHSGELSLDSKKFKEVLAEDYQDVLGLFITKGFSSNANVSMGRYTDETVTGAYELEEVDATHVRIRKSGDTEWYTSATRDGDVVTFGEGPAKGLSLSLEAGILAGGTASFTFSRGVGELVSLNADQLTKTNTGLISIRQKSFTEGIKRMDDRIDRLENSVESFRLRLVKQFSALEQAMAKLKSQNSNLLSALGS